MSDHERGAGADSSAVGADSRAAWTDAVRFPPSVRSMMRCGLSILRHTSTHPQCIAPLRRTEGRLFSMKIIRCQRPVRNGYAVGI